MSESNIKLIINIIGGMYNMSTVKRITDVSEKYAVMCKKANEFINTKIQLNKLVYSKIEGDNGAQPDVYIVTEENIDKLIEPIRVFTQREMEKLVFEPDKTTVQNFEDFAIWVKEKEKRLNLMVDSMEQLMLCHLMGKVYFREWDGEKWVIQVSKK